MALIDFVEKKKTLTDKSIAIGLYVPVSELYDLYLLKL